MFFFHCYLIGELQLKIIARASQPSLKIPGKQCFCSSACQWPFNRGTRSPSKTQCPPNKSPLQPLTLFFNIYAHRLCAGGQKIIIIIRQFIRLVEINTRAPYIVNVHYSLERDLLSHEAAVLQWSQQFPGNRAAQFNTRLSMSMSCLLQRAKRMMQRSPALWHTNVYHGDNWAPS